VKFVGLKIISLYIMDFLNANKLYGGDRCECCWHFI